MQKYNPDYVLILSGDHIYKMDYAARCSRRTWRRVRTARSRRSKFPMKEASRFGILNTNADGSIYQFEEKPKQPKSNLASMGIYIFTASRSCSSTSTADDAEPRLEQGLRQGRAPRHA